MGRSVRELAHGRLVAPVLRRLRHGVGPALVGDRLDLQRRFASARAVCARALSALWSVIETYLPISTLLDRVVIAGFFILLLKYLTRFRASSGSLPCAAGSCSRCSGGSLAPASRSTLGRRSFNAVYGAFSALIIVVLWTFYKLADLALERRVRLRLAQDPVRTELINASLPRTFDGDLRAELQAAQLRVVHRLGFDRRLPNAALTAHVAG